MEGIRMVRGFRIAALSAALSLFVVATATLAAPTPEAPDAVLNAVKNGPHAKIGPWLSNLYAEYQQAAGKGVAAKAFKSKNKALRSAKGMVSIDAYANDAAQLTRSLKALGAAKVKTRGPLVSAQVPVKALGQIAALTSLRSARPVLATLDALPPTAITQGDVSLNVAGACREWRQRLGSHGRHAVRQHELQSAALPAGSAEHIVRPGHRER
jgi:hypothetical protein